MAPVFSSSPTLWMVIDRQGAGKFRENPLLALERGLVAIPAVHETELLDGHRRCSPDPERRPEKSESRDRSDDRGHGRSHQNAVPPAHLPGIIAGPSAMHESSIPGACPI